eukprot:1489819-Alexandrium_andersonii.AAC.1
MTGLANRNTRGFHQGRYSRGHGATKFSRWLAGLHQGAPPDFVFRRGAHGVNAYLTGYEEYFEPYVVLCRSDAPRYDERFRGYGKNKISYLWELHTRQFRFAVLDHQEAFIVSYDHPRSHLHGLLWPE